MASTLPADFDTHTQDFTLIDQNGEEFTTNMAEVEYLRQYGIRVAINWATQIGASIVLLLVLLLLTRREKRRSSIFIMNCLCLVLNIIRSLLQCLWLTTEMFNPYAILAGDYSRITSADRANTIASNTILTILLACIMVSLSLQVWVVCVTAKPMHRFLIMGGTTLAACVAVGYRFAVTVISNIRTMQDLGMGDYDSLVTDMHITQAVAVWLYSCVFTFKLGYALLQRKRMKMTQFGPMQIIFIMGCQTMVIPALFSSLQFYDQVPELASQSTTIICIFLPLSAIWASLVSTDSTLATHGPGCHQRLLKDQFFGSSTNSTAVSTGSRSTDKGRFCAPSTFASCGKDSEDPATPFASRPADYSRTDAIYIGREYGIEMGEASDKA
ncbi:hypothetical protein K458DRAFT_297423 [Lentithecium fluviatile CBS 122367]|uniref:Uncharacterized protein n=1 Tax=Lentithecium fluviatile CBS 122367 TaxID=1168545 RepID=A0A6G1JA16_9PLEO|nr:hypothetical protein K458DRAFT_297423 [Lentithecium fluviatile CBS 122367]